MRLILASTSPARLAILRDAGIEPTVIAPDVDEEKAVALRQEQLGRELEAFETVEFLARLKAEDVARKIPAEEKGLVLGGDSVFLLDGKVLGKPHFADVAFERAKKHRGKTGVLFSGHWLIDLTKESDPETGFVGEGAVDEAEVTLSADTKDTELRAYVQTGEPLKLAGGFAIDGLAGAYIESIKGAPSCVMGLSLPALRRLVIKLGYEYHELWAK